MKKLLAMVLALVMTLSLAVSANAAFKDVKDIDETYAEAVEVLTGMKVFKGYEDGSFLPKNAITRAEVAAIVYRIYTTDVKDTYVKNYETYNKFADMAGAGWAKGYIGYCANAALVKGYPDGTFKPSGKVTGYEVLAMILRAVGYDQKGEFTGADWALHVAEIAEQNKILKNVKGVDLNAPATRELVSELLFQSIQVPMVSYTAAFGYQNVSLTGDKDKNLLKNNATLGYKNFGLICGEDEDEWGRPTKVWANDVNESGKYESSKDSAYATIAYKADASFQAATAQCDILKELGTKKDVKGDLIVNGQKLDAVTLKDVTGKVGAQGRQIEVFYKYNDAGDTRVVMIDTFLAYVDGTAEAKFDKNGHMTTPYTMTLYVYDQANEGRKVVLEDKDEAFTYEEGDYVLVNAYTDKVNSANESGKVLNNKDQYVEVIGKAESFVGAQTKIWKNAAQHTVADKVYDDAYKFLLNEAGSTGTTAYTWFLDQFGNLIGAVKVDNSSYAVLKDIIWKDGKPGAAYATLVYMDGTEKEDVEVSYIDGIKDPKEENVTGNVGDFVKQYDNLDVEKSEMAYFGRSAYVSASSRYNKYYEGIALFRVDALKDGDVELNGYGIIDHAKGVTLKKDASSVMLTSKTKINLTRNTQFLVRSENDKGEWIYTPYTRSNLPDFAENSVELYYYVGGDGYAKYVYVKNATLEADLGTHAFIPQGQYGLQVEKNVWEMDVVIDGVERTIRTNKAIAEYLSENTGKLFHVEFADRYDNTVDAKYGEVVDATLVNEEWDSDGNQNVEHDGYDCDYITYYDLSKAEVQQIAKGIKAGTIYSPNSEHNWQITDKTVFINQKGNEIKSLDNVVLEDHDIWVIGSTEKGSYEHALVVYVGEKLDKSVALDVTAKDGSVVYNAETKTFAFTSKKDATSDELTFTANDANSVLVYDSGNALYTATVTTTNGDTKWTVTVHNEAATEKETYTVTLKWDTSSNNTTLKSASISETGAHPTALDVASITGNADLATAAATPKHLNVTTGKQYNVSVAATSDAAKVEIVSAENVAAAASALPATAPASATNTASAQVDGNTALNGGIVVVRVTAENGDVMYYVFSAAEAPASGN